MSMKALKDTVKKARRDPFPEGTVIRWTSVGNVTRFAYAAIKTEVGWFTTARAGNPYVPQVMDFNDLLDVLGKSEVAEVAVAESWTEVTA